MSGKKFQGGNEIIDPADFDIPPIMNISLRQWYAGMSIQGILTTTNGTVSDIARMAFKLADAMLEFERNER